MFAIYCIEIEPSIIKVCVGSFSLLIGLPSFLDGSISLWLFLLLVTRFAEYAVIMMSSTFGPLLYELARSLLKTYERRSDCDGFHHFFPPSPFWISSSNIKRYIGILQHYNLSTIKPSYQPTIIAEKLLERKTNLTQSTRKKIQPLHGPLHHHC